MFGIGCNIGIFLNMVFITICVVFAFFSVFLLCYNMRLMAFDIGVHVLMVSIGCWMYIKMKMIALACCVDAAETHEQMQWNNGMSVCKSMHTHIFKTVAIHTLIFFLFHEKENEKKKEKCEKREEKERTE